MFSKSRVQVCYMAGRFHVISVVMWKEHYIKYSTTSLVPVLIDKLTNIFAASHCAPSSHDNTVGSGCHPMTLLDMHYNAEPAVNNCDLIFFFSCFNFNSQTVLLRPGFTRVVRGIKTASQSLLHCFCFNSLPLLRQPAQTAGMTMNEGGSKILLSFCVSG